MNKPKEPEALIATREMEDAMREAWKIIDVLYMDALDHNGESWPRAREWQEKWAKFNQANPDNKNNE
jgi:hypothetical protein